MTVVTVMLKPLVSSVPWFEVTRMPRTACWSEPRRCGACRRRRRCCWSRRQGGGIVGDQDSRSGGDGVTRVGIFRSGQSQVRRAGVLHGDAAGDVAIEGVCRPVSHREGVHRGTRAGDSCGSANGLGQAGDGLIKASAGTRSNWTLPTESCSKLRVVPTGRALATPNRRIEPLVLPTR